MLMNFCDPRLLSEAKCNTASNEGNEVINLTNGTDNGFIAYYAVRPPVHIDIKFICKIQISHIIIWPNVGAQKSSGLRLSTKPYDGSEHKDVITTFLKTEDAGLFLYRNDFDYSNVIKPPNFVQRYIQLSKFQTINATDNIRLTIIKTENSVPAIKRIEVWGKVSNVCKESTKTTVELLWNKRNNDEQLSNNLSSSTNNNEENKLNTVNKEIVKDNLPLDVPEDFLDPITCEIMTRPILLPSGKIIDHSTLEKHEKSETAWGRKLSDPFTGLPFNEKRVAIPALALKERIDKFLLVNCNNEEVKKLPRVLGSRQKRPAFSTEVVIQKQKAEVAVISQNKKRKCESQEEKPKLSHNLPFSTLSKPSRFNLVPKVKNKQMINDSRDEQIVHSNLTTNNPRKVQKSDNIIRCDCCTDKILYKLPCKHVICRKTLLSNENKCKTCNIMYRTSEPIRIYV